MAPWGSSQCTVHSTVLIILFKLVRVSTIFGLLYGVLPAAADGSDARASWSEQQEQLQAPEPVHLEHEGLPPDIPDEEHVPAEEVPSETPLKEFDQDTNHHTDGPQEANHDTEGPDLPPEEEVPPATPPRHARRDSFRALDVNSDGYVTRSEFENGNAGQPCATASMPPAPVPGQLTPDLAPEEEIAVLCKRCQETAGLGPHGFHARCVAAKCPGVWIAPLKPPPAPAYHGVNTVDAATREANKFTRLETEVLEKSGQSQAAAEIVRRDEQEDEAPDSEAVGINIVVAVLGIGLTACSGIVLGYEIEEGLRKKKAAKAAAEDAPTQSQTPLAGAGWEQAEGEEQAWGEAGGEDWGQPQQDATAQPGGEWGQAS